MKKLALIIASIILMSNYSFAQEGEVTVGVSGGYGGDLESFGVGARVTYGLTDRFRIAPAFTYYLENRNVSAVVIDANLHYMIKTRRMMSFYPLAGASIVLRSVSTSGIVEEGTPIIDDNYYEADKRSSTSVGINLGAGFQYEFNQQFRMFAEVYKVVGSDIPQIAGTVGIAFVFF